MEHSIEFTRTFEHFAWVDGIDRVTASGDNGFNARLHALQADLDAMAATVAELNAALNDARNDLYLGAVTAVRDCVSSKFSLKVGVTTGLPGNEFHVVGGTAIVGGRPARLPFGSPHRYSEQPWTDPDRAAADGVAVIPPLTTPSIDRIDLVYLDTWERQAVVDGTPRIVREVAVRVVEGSTALPPDTGEHRHLRLAFLHRPANTAQIGSADIDDIRPIMNASPSSQVLSLAPAFLAGPGFTPWDYQYVNLNVFAVRTGSVSGFLPLHVPHGARLTFIGYHGKHTVTGTGTATAAVYFARTSISDPTVTGTVVPVDTVTANTTSSFNRTVPVEGRNTSVDIVDNSSFLYWIWVDGFGSNSKTEIYGLTVGYTF